MEKPPICPTAVVPHDRYEGLRRNDRHAFILLNDSRS
jgi:hypothetical protein